MREWMDQAGDSDGWPRLAHWTMATGLLIVMMLTVPLFAALV